MVLKRHERCGGPGATMMAPECGVSLPVGAAHCLEEEEEEVGCVYRSAFLAQLV